MRISELNIVSQRGRPFQGQSPDILCLCASYVLATWWGLVQTSIGAKLPSGKRSASLVQHWISRLSRLITLFV